MNSIHEILNWIKNLSIEESLISIFFIFLLCEWIFGRLKRLKIHETKDSVRNFLIGAISFFSDFLFTILTIPIWLYMFSHLKLFTFDQENWLSFFILFILLDFSEYWFHRLSHEVNLLWSAHIVHHQSSFFNLTVGLRTSIFVPFFNIFFYSLFPILGFSPENVLLVILIQGIYQLLIHTELIGKLGILEYLIVTPSTHRVHHGKNEIYIDKNYGKCLVFWDQLFGTYQKETEKVEFGITKPLKKSGAIYSTIYPFQKLVKALILTKNKKDRKIILFNKPAEAEEIVDGNRV